MITVTSTANPGTERGKSSTIAKDEGGNIHTLLFWILSKRTIRTDSEFYSRHQVFPCYRKYMVIMKIKRMCKL